MPSENAAPNPHASSTAERRKLVYLIWPSSGQSREETRRILLEESAPLLLEKGAGIREVLRKNLEMLPR